MRTFRQLVVLFLALTGASCTVASRTAVIEGLRLAVTPEQTRVHIGEGFRVKYTLTNASAADIEACYTFKDGYDLWGTKGVRQNINTVDHPICIATFALSAGESISWTEVIDLPDVGEGPAAFTGWVQVALPRSCGEHGCDQRVVRGARHTLHVARPLQQP